MSLEVIEMVVNCRVPREESEEYVIRLRSGERLVHVPVEFHCHDAFDIQDQTDPATTIIRSRFARPRRNSG
jgi:hypothetical protein